MTSGSSSTIRTRLGTLAVYLRSCRAENSGDANDVTSLRLVVVLARVCPAAADAAAEPSRIPARFRGTPLARFVHDSSTRRRRAMTCPRCQEAETPGERCPRCGVVVATYLVALEKMRRTPA